MNNSFHLKNALYLDKEIEIIVKDGIIEEVGTNLQSNLEVVDANKLVLFPSFVDCHVHLREPGYEWKEDIKSGLTAALHGGFVRVACMANTNPVNDSAAVTHLILDKAKAAYPNGPYVMPIAGATIGLKGKELAPLAELKEAGCIAVSNDGVPITDTTIVRRVMEYAHDLGLLFIDHCEEPFMAIHTHANESALSTEMGLKAQPDIAEAMQAARDAMLSEYLDIPSHIAHVSAKITLDYIQFAKSRNVKITAETCPHYLLLDENELRGYNTNAKVNPPLRDRKDVDAVRAAIKNGTIDIMVTDHAPHSEDEKNHPFDKTPNGMTGLDTALSLSWRLYKENVFTLEDIVRLWVTKPLELFNMPKHGIEKGMPAHFFLFDPEITWKVSAETLYSKSANTPFLGQDMEGRVVKHFIHGIDLINS